MRQSSRWAAALLVVSSLVLSACATAGTEEQHQAPAAVEPIEGTELHRVILSQKAAERLGIQVAAVRDEQVGGQQRRVVPYGAVLYDAHGETWTYTSPQSLTFVRHRISVDSIQGDRVVLSDGPPTGTTVVVVGAVLLLGAENGVGH